MTSLHGILKLGDKVLLEKILVSIKQSADRGGHKSWSGSFIAPAGTSLDDDGPYRLVLDDGRSGNILISTITPNGNVTLVEFESTGMFG